MGFGVGYIHWWSTGEFPLPPPTSKPAGKMSANCEELCWPCVAAGLLTSDLQCLLTHLNSYSLQTGFTDSTLSGKLRTTLRRISDNLILRAGEADVSAAGAGPGAAGELLPGGGGAAAAAEEAHGPGDRIPHPHISPIVDLSDPGRLYGLAERTIATESL